MVQYAIIVEQSNLLMHSHITCKNLRLSLLMRIMIRFSMSPSISCKSHLN